MYTIINLFGRLLNALETVIVVYCVISWFPTLRESRVYEILGRIVEPFARPFRGISYRISRALGIGIDFSLWFAVLALQLIYSLMIRIVR